MNSRFQDIGLPVQGTCDWLILHERYKEWVASDRRLLWIKGKPGSGKSTLLRYAFEDATTKFGEKSLMLSFFFHGRGAEMQKTKLGFYRSLLHQMLLYASDTHSDLLTTFNQRCESQGEPDRGWLWSLPELRSFFESSLGIILTHRSVWLFVDALDECGKKDAIELASNFNSLLDQVSSGSSQFHICFTCRHYPIVSLNYGLEICPEHENKEAIFAYVQDRLPPRVPYSIREKVTSRASGVFMWTRLVTERILNLELDGMGWAKIEERINIIPDDLDGLYQDLVKGMTDKAVSIKLIRWICFAMNPLTLDEIRWAVIIDAELPYQSIQQYQSDFVDDCQMIRQIHTLSCGLAETVNVGGNCPPVIQFIHESVYDFFIDKGLLVLENRSGASSLAIANAHYQLSRTCIRYLSMKEITESLMVIRYLDHDRLRLRFPLLIYATMSWAHHERESELREVQHNDLLQHVGWPSEHFTRLWVHTYSVLLSRELLQLKNKNSRLEAGYFSGDVERTKNLWDYWPPKGTHMIHVVSQYQLTRPLRTMIQEMEPVGFDINVRDSFNQTPLIIAAKLGHEAIVKLLLEKPSTDVNVRNWHQPTPLCAAARWGYENIVTLLLDVGKAEADLAESSGQTPLATAAHNGHEHIVQLLLKTGKVNVNTRGQLGRTPLFWASIYGHVRVIQILLNIRNVDVNLKDDDGSTPLQAAISHGQHESVRALLSTGKININLKDNQGSTAIHRAARYRQPKALQLLIDTNKLRLNSKDQQGNTALLIAVKEGTMSLPSAVEKSNRLVVRLLLGSGKVDVHAMNNNGETPMLVAAEAGYNLLEVRNWDITDSEANSDSELASWV
ncbi:hypothetical protein RRF57_005822 [Xylaria bambusicola]|uniref:Nephrocystin 3-like N-terminal domain-containing protein n=1 Tax=Xylaria bambusicola TaxID=326684 RepID=A0AAN7Z539_9PEZI